jgi:hypothetical protein
MPEDGMSLVGGDFPVAQQAQPNETQQDAGDKEECQGEHCFLLMCQGYKFILNSLHLYSIYRAMNNLMP